VEEDRRFGADELRGFFPNSYLVAFFAAGCFQVSEMMAITDRCDFLVRAEKRCASN
jgi:hypothetical protein